MQSAFQGLINYSWQNVTRDANKNVKGNKHVKCLGATELREWKRWSASRKTVGSILDFKLSPCSVCCMFSSG